MSARPDWINEETAAALLEYKPETLRKLVKAGRLDISWTTVRGRSYKYDRKDIEKLLLKSATLIQ